MLALRLGALFVALRRRMRILCSVGLSFIGLPCVSCATCCKPCGQKRLLAFPCSTSLSHLFGLLLLLVRVFAARVVLVGFVAWLQRLLRGLGLPLGLLFRKAQNLGARCCFVHAAHKGSGGGKLRCR